MSVIGGNKGSNEDGGGEDYDHCTYIHARIHTYIHTYIHTCMHTCIHKDYVPRRGKKSTK